MSRRFTYEQCHVQGHGRRATLPSDGASRLHALLGEALAGRPRLVLCSNEAWTGKTAPLRQFTDEAARRDVRVVWPPSFGSPGRRRTGSGVTR